MSNDNSSQHLTLKPSAAIDAVAACIRADVAFNVQGPPGVGKSAIIFEAARRAGCSSVTDIRLLIREPIDVIGLPHIDANGRTAYSRPAILPEFGDGDADVPMLLFFDELNAAPPMVQACAYSVMYASPGQPRMLGEHPLPSNVRVGAAGNYDTDRAVTHRMPTPLRSRMVHINFVTDLDEWVTWAAGSDNISTANSASSSEVTDAPVFGRSKRKPKAVTTAAAADDVAAEPVSRIRPEVIAFLRFRPNLLHQFSHDTQTFPCPRTWELASRVLDAAPGAAEHALLAGAVGMGAATEMIAFLQTWRDLPDIDGIIADPKRAPVPQRNPAVLYAIATALAYRMAASNVAPIIDYLRRLPKEFYVMAMKDAINRQSTAVGTKAFTNAAAGDLHEVLF